MAMTKFTKRAARYTNDKLSPREILAQCAKLLAEAFEPLGHSTREAYTKDLDDFAGTFLRVDDRVCAVRRLLAGDFATANELVREYRDGMDQKRELSSSPINRRLSVLRKLVHAAHRRSMVNW